MKRAKRLFDGVYRADGGDRVAARFGWMWEAMIRERVRDDFAIRRQLRPATPIKSVDDAADDDSSSSVGFGDHSDLDEEMSLKPAPFDWRTGSVEEKNLAELEAAVAERVSDADAASDARRRPTRRIR